MVLFTNLESGFAGYQALPLRDGRITALLGSCGEPLPAERDVDHWIVEPTFLIKRPIEAAL